MTQQATDPQKPILEQVSALMQQGAWQQAEQLALGTLSVGGLPEGALPNGERAKTADFDVQTLASLWCLVGACRDAQTQWDAALQAFEQALQINPNLPMVYAAKAAVFSKSQQYEHALQAAQQAVKLAPQAANFWANLGVAHQQMAEQWPAQTQTQTQTQTQLQQYAQAQNAYQEALRLNPREPTALTNTPAMSLKLRLPELAKKQALAGLRMLPNHVEILNNLIEACIQCFDYKAAADYCLLALKLQPQRALFYYKLGLIDAALGRDALALHALGKIQAMQPEKLADYGLHIPAQQLAQHWLLLPKLIRLNELTRQHQQGDWRYFEAYTQHMQTLVAQAPDDLPIAAIADTMHHMLSLPINAAARCKLAQKIAQLETKQAETAGLVQNIAFRQKSHQRLRIGYLSPDFRMHAVGQLSNGVFSRHDASQFETFAYSLTQMPDARTREFAQAFAHFADVSHWDNARIIKQIMADEIDILVDLAGYTGGARPAVMAARPAPVQVAYLGYPGTAGGLVDYTLSDVVTAAQPEHWAEALLRLPHAYCPYDTSIANQALTLHRGDYGLPPDSVILCAFHSPNKIDSQIFACWMRILKAVPQAVLWLVSYHPATEARWQAEANKQGVAAQRLVFAPQLVLAEHLKRYQVADLFLDTLWHNAHTTAMDALWQGLPVISCMGEAPSSRLAASVLTALQMPELITTNLAEYEQKVIYFATNAAKRLAMHEKLIQKRATAPLFNIHLTVKHIEAAYQQIWQRYQAGLAPATIDICAI